MTYSRSSRSAPACAACGRCVPPYAPHQDGSARCRECLRHADPCGEVAVSTVSTPFVTDDDARLLALLYRRFPPPTRFDEYNITANFDTELLAAMRYLGVRRLKTRYALNRGAEVVVRAMLERVQDRPFGAGDRWLAIGRSGWCGMVSTSAVTLQEMIDAINVNIFGKR